LNQSKKTDFSSSEQVATRASLGSKERPFARRVQAISRH
jgi:hypothetical protein